MLDAMDDLIFAASTSLMLEDMQGKNAIEYALESEVDILVLRRLQRSCVKQCKNNVNNGWKRKRSYECIDFGRQKMEQNAHCYKKLKVLNYDNHGFKSNALAR